MPSNERISRDIVLILIDLAAAPTSQNSSATAPNRPHAALFSQSQHITTLQILHRDAESAYLESRRMLDAALQGSFIPHVPELPAQPSMGPMMVNRQSHHYIQGSPSIQYKEHPSILPFVLSSQDGSEGNGHNPNQLNTAKKARRGLARNCDDSSRSVTKSSRIEKVLKTPRRVSCIKKVAAEARKDKAAKAKSAKAKAAKEKSVNEKAKTKAKQIEDGIAETDDEATELARVKKEKAWAGQANIRKEVSPQVKLEPLDEKHQAAVSPRPMSQNMRPQWLIPGMGEDILGFRKTEKEEDCENKAALKKEVTPRVKLEFVD